MARANKPPKADAPKADTPKPAKAPKPVPADPKTVVVKNQYTGKIIFPVRGQEGMVFSPLILEPGRATPVPVEVWNEYKKLPAVQAYLDHGLLDVGGKVGRANLATDGSEEDENLPIPEHLQTSEKAKETVAADGTGTVKAGLAKLGADRAVEVK